MVLMRSLLLLSRAFLLKYLESRVFHEFLVEFLELLKRVSVVLTGSLGEDFDPEVCLADLLLVLSLILCRYVISLAL
jgi:hypothetical protein